MPDFSAGALAGAVRRHDPDRYFTALFAPAVHRDTLFTLYAFNHELARAPEATSEPGLALIRLQWWREVVEGAVRNHEVATPLSHELAAGRLHRDDLLAMIDARETEAEGEIPTLEAWRDWLLQGAGALCVAAGRALGAPPADWMGLRRLGAGIGAAGQLRNIEPFARQGRCLLPGTLLAAHGLSREAVVASPDGPALASIRPGLAALRKTLAAEAGALLGAPATRRTWVAAALPAVLARRDLTGRGALAAHRTTADRLAIIAAALRRRA